MGSAGVGGLDPIHIERCVGGHQLPQEAGGQDRVVVEVDHIVGAGVVDHGRRLGVVVGPPHLTNRDPRARLKFVEQLGRRAGPAGREGPGHEHRHVAHRVECGGGRRRVEVVDREPAVFVNATRGAVEVVGQFGETVAPVERGLGKDEVARAPLPLRFEVVDRGESIDRVEAGPPALAGLGKVPSGLGVEVDEAVVATGDHEHRRAGLGDHLDPFPDRGGVGPPRRAFAGVGATNDRPAGTGHHRVDDLVESNPYGFEPVPPVDVIGAGIGQAVPQLVVGEQAGHPGRHVSRVGRDQGVAALHQIQPLGTDRGGDHGGVGHHRLEHLALDSRPVEQRHTHATRDRST